MFLPRAPLRIAVVGAGVSGLSAAWLLGQRHEVTLYESEPRLGGHVHTVDAPTPSGPVPVDTGFIVYNEPNYPNLVALFAHLGVRTQPAPMSFSVSINGGALEYSSDLAGLFAQPRNLASPRFWGMLCDVARFHRTAPAELDQLDASGVALGSYLDQRGYGKAFRDHHLLPQAAAIWSCSTEQMADYPAGSFVRFCQNHRLLQVGLGASWRTVVGGARAYRDRLLAGFGGRIARAQPVVRVVRGGRGCGVWTRDDYTAYDHVVLAAHADQALALLQDPTPAERRLLGAIPYRPNRAVLHRDERLMPRRRAAWAAWNYVGGSGAGESGVTYWMNRLQSLPGPPLFVSLNPAREPDPAAVVLDQTYTHPVFSAEAVTAQRDLWGLQDVGGIWFCGAYFGWGFHEDGLQAGLAVAEQLGGVRRPWDVAAESGRIALRPAPSHPQEVAG